MIFVYVRGRENDMTNINKKSSMYIIERGIPTPCHPNKGKWATIVSEMNDGDSIVVATYSETNSMRQAIIRDGTVKGGVTPFFWSKKSQCAKLFCRLRKNIY